VLQSGVSSSSAFSAGTPSSAIFYFLSSNPFSPDYFLSLSLSEPLTSVLNGQDVRELEDREDDAGAGGGGGTANANPEYSTSADEGFVVNDSRKRKQPEGGGGGTANANPEYSTSANETFAALDATSVLWRYYGAYCWGVQIPLSQDGHGWYTSTTGLSARATKIWFHQTGADSSC
jgi:hypothetical protein